MATIADVTVDGSTATFDRDGYPTVAVTEDGETLSAVITGVEMEAPTRTVSAAEQAAGITSLDPPTCSTNDGARELVNLAQIALSSAVANARGTLSGPEDMMLRHRVAVATCAALRALDYEV